MRVLGFGCTSLYEVRPFPYLVQGSGLRVQDLRVYGSRAGCRVQGLECRVQGAGFGVQGSGFRVQGLGFRVQGAGCIA